MKPTVTSHKPDILQWKGEPLSSDVSVVDAVGGGVKGVSDSTDFHRNEWSLTHKSKSKTSQRKGTNGNFKFYRKHLLVCFSYLSFRLRQLNQLSLETLLYISTRTCQSFVKIIPATVLMWSVKNKPMVLCCTKFWYFKWPRCLLVVLSITIWKVFSRYALNGWPSRLASTNTWCEISRGLNSSPAQRLAINDAFWCLHLNRHHFKNPFHLMSKIMAGVWLEVSLH